MDYTVEVLKKCKEYGFKVSFSSTGLGESSFETRKGAEKLTYFFRFLCSRSSWTLIRTSYVYILPFSCREPNSRADLEHRSCSGLVSLEDQELPTGL